MAIFKRKKEADVYNELDVKKNASNVSDGMIRFNRVSPVSNALYSALFILIAAVCVLPVLFVIIISFTSEQSIGVYGYSFFPKELSVSSYKYVWNMRDLVGRSFLNSIGITIVGTCLGVILTSTMGYTLSRKNYKFRNFYTWFIFIPMLFRGGTLASYVVNTQIMHLKDTYWALILPICCSTFNIIIMRTFFTTTVPDEMIESGKIDGANQLRIFVQLVLPICLPAIATIALFLTFAYWNEWFHASIYISSTRSDLFPLQYVLVSIEQKIQWLINNAGNVSADAQDIPSETMRMAIVVIAVVPIMFSYPFFQKYYISGLTVGAVKG
ncbi:MAG: carbohydrate ABC transporter permease [Clostridia bacterium]|nr:carbohydrate ABC transporter permease [Clostridia bacterium]MBQ6858878.1 carbohydrate ABC transporter permease [Clostridia bacterium]MBQ7052771.1 carbohydrate ABC transporter permease [Clostridia bacterium]